MQSDSIDTLLLRHYGSTAPAPAELEEQLTALVRREAPAIQARQEAVDSWNQRRVSRRRVLQLVTFSGASLSVLALGIDALQLRQKQPAYSV